MEAIGQRLVKNSFEQILFEIKERGSLTCVTKEYELLIFSKDLRVEDF